MPINRPRLVLAALRGSAGKTTLAIAIAAALKARGVNVYPFKKGPDYIDAAWLSLAASCSCRNLDTFMMAPREVRRSFLKFSQADGIAIIEGNRGLYDGMNVQGDHSTAELAKLLNAPVILVVDCDKVTRTVAAIVLGCMGLDPAVDIRGVILNRVGGERHAALVRRVVEENCEVPVVGIVPRMEHLRLAERHLGLVPPAECGAGQEVMEQAAIIGEEYLDLSAIVRLGKSAQGWPHQDRYSRGRRSRSPEEVTIGIIRDTVFHFYYPENLESLRGEGARIVAIDALRDTPLPEIDALYMGGGFPEVHVERLAHNRIFLRSLREQAERGLPIYAECGGLIYLGTGLECGGQNFPLAGILPLRFTMERKPQGHGYTEVEVDRNNPFFPVGMKWRGHEFHYCRVISPDANIHEHTVFRMERGLGLHGRRDGYCQENILASFTHLHALGTPMWAKGMVERAKAYQIEKETSFGFTNDGEDPVWNKSIQQASINM